MKSSTVFLTTAVFLAVSCGLWPEQLVAEGCWLTSVDVAVQRANFDTCVMIVRCMGVFIPPILTFVAGGEIQARRRNELRPAASIR